MKDFRQWKRVWTDATPFNVIWPFHSAGYSEARKYEAREWGLVIEGGGDSAAHAGDVISQRKRVLLAVGAKGKLVAVGYEPHNEGDSTDIAELTAYVFMHIGL